MENTGSLIWFDYSCTIYLVQLSHIYPVGWQGNRGAEVLPEERAAIWCHGRQGQQEVSCGPNVELFACVQCNLDETHDTWHLIFTFNFQAHLIHEFICMLEMIFINRTHEKQSENNFKQLVEEILFQCRPVIFHHTVKKKRRRKCIQHKSLYEFATHSSEEKKHQ